jgi:hypothetical protein
MRIEEAVRFRVSGVRKKIEKEGFRDQGKLTMEVRAQFHA